MDTFNTFGISDKAWNAIAFLFRKKSRYGRPKKHLYL